MINRAGEKVSAEEVENLVIDHPKISAAALVPIADPVVGERGCLFVVCEQGETIGLSEVVAHLEQKRVAKFKFPERLEVVDSFPTTAVGKIAKKVLRDRIERTLTPKQRRASTRVRHLGRSNHGDSREPGCKRAQYHNEYRALTGAANFETATSLPDEYRDLLVRMLSIQARIELEYMLVPQRTLLRPMDKAPSPEDRAEYAAFWAEEVRHGSYWWRILEGLGVTIDEKFMSTPMPIYLFEMRDLSEDWVEYAFFSFFGDRQGAYMGFEWVGCTYAPLAKISERVWREEIGHAAFGYTLLRRVCQSPKVAKLPSITFPSGMRPGWICSDRIAPSVSTITSSGVCASAHNKQMRDDFTVEVNELLNKVGLPIPDADCRP